MYFKVVALCYVKGSQHQSSVISHQSSVISHQSPVISHQSSVISHQSPVISHQSSVISHQSSVISHQSLVISHQSSVINPQSIVTWQTISGRSSAVWPTNNFSTISLQLTFTVNVTKSVGGPVTATVCRALHERIRMCRGPPVTDAGKSTLGPRLCAP